MTTALSCVLIAGLMPYAWTITAKVVGKSYDNRDPRAWQSRLAGLPARARAAHLNSFEAFPLFAAAVLSVLVMGGDREWLDKLAFAYVALRLAYGLAYMIDQATLRSLLWFAALACNIAIFLQAS